MLFRSVNRSQPTLPSLNPQFVCRDQLRGRVIECTDPNFDIVYSINEIRSNDPHVTQKCR